MIVITFATFICNYDILDCLVKYGIDNLGGRETLAKHFSCDFFLSSFWQALALFAVSVLLICGHTNPCFIRMRFFQYLILFAGMLDLSAKKCVACSSKDLRPMTEEAANNLIPKVSGSMLYLLCCLNYI